MHARPAHATEHNYDHDDLRDEFVERAGVIAQDEGFPRIAGRIMGALLYTGSEMSFSELAERLGVSRGSISTNVRMLAERGVVERVGRPGDRQDWFRIDDDVFEGLLRNAARRAANAGASIAKVRDRMPDGPARTRVARYARFYEAIERGVSAAAEDL